jgi:hypothetical protein
VGLAQTHAAIEKERVVGARRLFGHSQAGGMRQTVAGTDHEGVEDITRVHVRVARWLFVTLGRRGMGLIEGFGEGGRRFIGDVVILQAMDDEMDIHGRLENVHKQAVDGSCKAAFEPVAGIRIAHTDGQCAVTVGNWFGVTHPGIKGGTRHLHLKLPKNRLPCLISVHICSVATLMDGEGRVELTRLVSGLF